MHFSSEVILARTELQAVSLYAFLRKIAAALISATGRNQTVRLRNSSLADQTADFDRRPRLHKEHVREWRLQSSDPTTATALRTVEVNQPFRGLKQYPCLC